jgi:hypothetical protein
MTRALLLIAALSSLVTPACTADCVEDACQDALRAQPKGELMQGITGVVAYRTDACEQSCCECSYGASVLRVYAVDEPVLDDEDAQIRLTTRMDLTRVDAEERYAQALEPGRYAVCDQDLETCANLVIEAGEVYTVNIQTVYGPTQMRVFDPDGERLTNAVVGRGAPY